MLYNAVGSAILDPRFDFWELSNDALTVGFILNDFSVNSDLATNWDKHLILDHSTEKRTKSGHKFEWKILIFFRTVSSIG